LSTSEKIPNLCGKIGDLLDLGGRNRLASLDVLKSWIDTNKSLNFMTKGWE